MFSLPGSVSITGQFSNDSGTNSGNFCCCFGGFVFRKAHVWLAAYPQFGVHSFILSFIHLLVGSTFGNTLCLH